MKDYNEESDEGFFLEVDIQYPEKLHELCNDLLFLPERTKTGKIENFVTNFHDKTEYFIHIRNLKQALNHGLIEIRKTQILINKPVYLGSSILDLNKTVMYEFLYNYVKPKYGENANLCYMDRNSFIVHLKTDDIYKTNCKRCWTKIWHFKFLIRQTIA